MSGQELKTQVQNSTPKGRGALFWINNPGLLTFLYQILHVEISPRPMRWYDGQDLN